MLAVSPPPPSLFSVATARRLLIAAAGIGTIALAFGVGRPEHVKLRILTHAIPDFRTWYDGVLGPYNEPDAPINAYDPKVGALREVFLTNDAEDRIFSLLFIGASSERKYMDIYYNGGRLLSFYSSWVDAGFAVGKMFSKIYRADDVLTQADVPGPWRGDDQFAEWMHTTVSMPPSPLPTDMLRPVTPIRTLRVAGQEHMQTRRPMKRAQAPARSREGAGRWGQHAQAGWRELTVGAEHGQRQQAGGESRRRMVGLVSRPRKRPRNGGGARRRRRGSMRSVRPNAGPTRGIEEAA